MIKITGGQWLFCIAQHPGKARAGRMSQYAVHRGHINVFAHLYRQIHGGDIQGGYSQCLRCKTPRQMRQYPFDTFGQRGIHRDNRL